MRHDHTASPPRPTAPSRSRLGSSLARRGFTLMELMVAVSILVVIILAVGVTFSGASKSVGMSQATMDLTADMRATQELMQRDLTGLDKNGFLVIRSRMYITTGLPQASSGVSIDNTMHMDQLSFMSLGSFPDRTGAATATPFSDTASSNAGLVWYGELLLEKNGPTPSYVAPNQAAPLSIGSNIFGWGPQAVPPTGMVINTSTSTPLVPTLTTNDPANVTIKDSNFILGRHVFLLMPGPGTYQQLSALGFKLSANGTQVMAYPSPAYTLSGVLGPTFPTGANTVPGVDGKVADVSSSRCDVVAQSPAQLMASIELADNGAILPNCAEAYLMTYRFRALNSIYDTENATNPFTNGYFRTTPILAQGVSSFKVEWTDGTSYTDFNDPEVRAYQELYGQNILGQLKWYGPTHPSGNRFVEADFFPKSNVVNGADTADNYVAVFNNTNHPYWPKALRITMHVGADRLQGGRDFVQIIKLPD